LIYLELHHGVEWHKDAPFQQDYVGKVEGAGVGEFNATINNL
jgi:hypothetical protein